MSCFLFFFACPPRLQLLAQEVPRANDGNRGTLNLASNLVSTPTVGLGFESDGQPPSPFPPPAKKPKKPYEWGIAIYPALAWVPIFGASVTLPSPPPLPGHPSAPGPSGSTSSSFNGAFFGGARIERGKWSADALFMWTDLSGERTNPLVKINLGFIFGDAMVGREVLPRLYLEGGFRRIALDITATVGSDSASRSPGFWDPLVGLTYSRQLGRKWRILGHADGGGFGVGSDTDIAVTGRAEWQFVRHFGLGMGYGVLHLNKTDTVANRSLTISPTLNGPIFGFGVYF